MCHIDSPVILTKAKPPSKLHTCTAVVQQPPGFTPPKYNNRLEKDAGDENTRSIKVRPTAAGTGLQLQRDRIIKGEGRFALSLRPLPSYRYSARTTRGCTRRRRKPRLTWKTGLAIRELSLKGSSAEQLSRSASGTVGGARLRRRVKEGHQMKTRSSSFHLKEAYLF